LRIIGGFYYTSFDSRRRICDPLHKHRTTPLFPTDLDIQMRFAVARVIY